MKNAPARNRTWKPRGLGLLIEKHYRKFKLKTDALPLCDGGIYINFAESDLFKLN